MEEHGFRKRRFDRPEDDNHIDSGLPARQQPLMHCLQSRGLIAMGEGHQHARAAAVPSRQMDRHGARERLQELVDTLRYVFAPGIADQVQHQPATGVPSCILPT